MKGLWVHDLDVLVSAELFLVSIIFCFFFALALYSDQFLVCLTTPKTL